MHENNRCWLQHIIVIESDVLKRAVRTPNWAQIKAVTRKYVLAIYMGEPGLEIGIGTQMIATRINGYNRNSLGFQCR